MSSHELSRPQSVCVISSYVKCLVNLMVFKIGIHFRSYIYIFGRLSFSVQSYGKAKANIEISKNLQSLRDSIFIIFLLSFFADFALLSTRKGKARREVKKNLSFIFKFNKRASAQKKVKVMKWSFIVIYRFDKFLDFIHNTKDIIIRNIEMSSLYLTVEDLNRGHYVVEYYIIDHKPKQLTLF